MSDFPPGYHGAACKPTVRRFGKRACCQPAGFSSGFGGTDQQLQTQVKQLDVGHGNGHVADQHHSGVQHAVQQFQDGAVGTSRSPAHIRLVLSSFPNSVYFPLPHRTSASVWPVHRPSARPPNDPRVRSRAGRNLPPPCGPTRAVDAIRPVRAKIACSWFSRSSRAASCTFWQRTASPFIGANRMSSKRNMVNSPFQFVRQRPARNVSSRR